ncbi:hypothetical protein ACFV4N_18425 [Actinosynnema sp. NPDC059797]
MIAVSAFTVTLLVIGLDLPSALAAVGGIGFVAQQLARWLLDPQRTDSGVAGGEDDGPSGNEPVPDEHGDGLPPAPTVAM